MLQPIRRIMSLAFVAVFLTVACGTGGTSGVPQANVEGGTVTVRLTGDWGNPIDGGHTVTSAPGGVLAETMYDRLVDFDYKTGDLKPYLASSWTVTPNSVTF